MNEGNALTVPISATDPDGDIVAYEWDLDNDGEYETVTDSAAMTRTWDTVFNGIIGLRVVDNDGLTATDTADVDIYEMPVDLCGDLDDDGDVDGDDRTIFRSALGTATGEDGFIEEADYDEDGDIDYSDYQWWYACYKEYINN